MGYMSYSPCEDSLRGKKEKNVGRELQVSEKKEKGLTEFGRLT